MFTAGSKLAMTVASSTPCGVTRGHRRPSRCFPVLAHPLQRLTNRWPIGSVVRDRVRILGEGEVNTVRFCLMNAVVNALIHGLVNGAVPQFSFVQEAARFPAETKLKHTANRRSCVARKKTLEHQPSPVALPHTSSNCDRSTESKITGDSSMS